MVGVRVVAAVVSLLNGAWGIVAGVYSNQLFGSQLSKAGGDIWIPIVSVLLVLDSVACLAGLRTAFYVSAALSILLIADFLLFGAALASTAFVASAILGLVTIVMDAFAVRHRELVSEENHPLNLPVFG